MIKIKKSPTIEGRVWGRSFKPKSIWRLRKSPIHTVAL